MTENTGTQNKYTKTLMMTGTGILALALLTGCSVADPGTSDASDDTAATASSDTAETTPATGDDNADDHADDQGSSTSSSSPTGSGEATNAATSGDDPVFAAIDALLAEHSDALIVEIDQDDDDTVYEIEAVVGDRVVDFDVLTDGTVREDDNDDDDDDDIRRAREADITAEEAARAALEGRDGSTIDSLSLDDDDDTLHWEVDLDNEQGNDADDLHVDAMTGEVTEDD